LRSQGGARFCSCRTSRQPWRESFRANLGQGEGLVKTLIFDFLYVFDARSSCFPELRAPWLQLQREPIGAALDDQRRPLAAREARLQRLEARQRDRLA